MGMALVMCGVMGFGVFDGVVTAHVKKSVAPIGGKENGGTDLWEREVPKSVAPIGGPLPHVPHAGGSRGAPRDLIPLYPPLSLSLSNTLSFTLNFPFLLPLNPTQPPLLDHHQISERGKKMPKKRKTKEVNQPELHIVNYLGDPNHASRMLECDHLHPPDPYNQIVEAQLRETGFYYVSQIGVIKGQSAMITALIERWRPETHTFHFPVGECAVTLEDVAVILGLPTNGLPVTGPTMSSFEALEAECLHHFGVAPRKNECRGSFIKLTWFRGVRDRIVLNDVVSMQMATRVDCKEMDGPLTLLVSWAWIRLPFLAPIPGNPRAFPIANMWHNWDRQNYAYRYKTLAQYRRLLDDLEEGQAYGIGYIEPDVIPLAIHHNSVVWSATVPLISFECIEWHATDRVRRQFGLTQGVPSEVQDLGASHGEVLTGPKNQDWANTHSRWVMQWTNRYSHILSEDLEHLHYPRSSTTTTTTGTRTGTGTGGRTSTTTATGAATSGVEYFAPYVPYTHPSDYYSASVPSHHQFWGGPHSEYGEQPSFSQLLGLMASGSHQSHSGNYIDIPTDHQAHFGGVTPARRSLDLGYLGRTSSDNSGARMSVDSSRSNEATGGIIQSGNPRRIPMTMIHESHRAVHQDEVEDESEDESEDEGDDEDESEDEGNDADESEDEGGDEDDDPADEDTAPSAGTATSEKGKGYNLRADPPRRSANRYTPSAFKRIAKKCRKIYKDIKWAPRK
ncbi:Serine/threonine protein phosphatase 7 long form isogeny [Arachis hypogaea]|nr:Serine/threonine protein phosphatase 7 long form isogeny [Arachis hypogaea]